jgi:hypothetical protein
MILFLDEEGTDEWIVLLNFSEKTAIASGCISIGNRLISCSIRFVYLILLIKFFSYSDLSDIVSVFNA